MLVISRKIAIPAREIEITSIRAQGAGGQHVNKASTAVHLRFDIAASSLPRKHKKRLLAWNDRRITQDGVIVIKSQEHRSREKNKKAALSRLRNLIKRAIVPPKKRKPTKPTQASRMKRLDEKKRRSRRKELRRKDFD